MNGQGAQYHGTSRNHGREETTWRQETVSQTPRPVRGEMTHKNLPSGTYLQDNRSRGAVSSFHQWKVTRSTETAFVVRPGSIGFKMGEIGGTRLDSLPRPTITLGGGSGQLYWRISADPLVANSGTDEEPYYYISGAKVTEVEVVSSASDDTPATIDRETGEFEGGTYFRHFATVVGGTVTYNRRYDLSANLCDLDAQGTLQLWGDG